MARGQAWCATCLVSQASLVLTRTQVWASWVGWLFSAPMAQEL